MIEDPSPPRNELPLLLVESTPLKSGLVHKVLLVSNGNLFR